MLRTLKDMGRVTILISAWHVCSFRNINFHSCLCIFRILNSTAVFGVTSPLEENEQVTFRFVVVNIDSANIIGGVFFQYVIPRLTSVPDNQIIEA